MVSLVIRSRSSASFTFFLVLRANRDASWLLCRGSRCCTTTMGGNSEPSPLSNTLRAGSPPAEAPIATSSHHRDFGTLRFLCCLTTTATGVIVVPASEFAVSVACQGRKRACLLGVFEQFGVYELLN